MTAATERLDAPGADARKLLAVALVSGVLLALVFQAFPGMDIAVSAALKQACSGDARHGGWCHENGVLWLPRWLAMAVSGLVCLTAAVLAFRASCGMRKAQCMVMLLTFALGPGLLTNVVLKDHWGRARPREVAELGGSRHFTPPLAPSRECDDNCSFVSGEAAGVFAPLFAASLILPRARLLLLLGGVIAGVAAGLVRVSTGGHFLSDVLFAGVLMAAVAAFSHWIVFGFHARWTEHRALIRRRVGAASRVVAIAALQSPGAPR